MRLAAAIASFTAAGASCGAAALPFEQDPRALPGRELEHRGRGELVTCWVDRRASRRAGGGLFEEVAGPERWGERDLDRVL